MKLRVDATEVPLQPAAVLIAGFTGRRRDEVEAHVRELAEEGVPPPETVPSFYLAPPTLVVQDKRISVTHARTSGEAEAVLAFSPEGVLVTLGSDHTDRAAETKDIELSKLVCPKILAREGWWYEDVRDHWDALEIRSWVGNSGSSDRVLYQEGRMGELLRPEELLERMPFRRLPEWLLFCGTFSLRGALRSSCTFQAELHDPTLGRTIVLRYSIDVLADLVSEG